MGRIPGFTNTIFPASSLHLLSLTSTFGLVIFLFIVAIEVDASLAKRNAKASLAISVAGLIVPLGLGAAIAVPIYHHLVEHGVHYGYFVLFIAVAVGITAFPVLCRILIEVRLLDTTVGILVLSAGVGNDCASDRCRLRHPPPLPCEMGFQVACSKNGKFGQGRTHGVHDDGYPDPRSYLFILHGYHRHPCHLW